MRPSPDAIDAILRIVSAQVTCPACGERPEIVPFTRASLESLAFDVALRAECHGSVERGMWRLFSDSDHPDLTPVTMWIASVFKRDAFPDMIELIRYNSHPFTEGAAR